MHDDSDLTRSAEDVVKAVRALEVGRKTMAKKPENHGKPWTPAENRQLRQEARENTPTRVIGLHLGRTADAVHSQASELGVSLKPTNQKPYGSQK